MPVRPDSITTYLKENHRVVPSDEHFVNYWCVVIDKAILYLPQAANALISRCVTARPPRTNARIDWVPLGDLAIPPVLSEIGDITPMVL